MAKRKQNRYSRGGSSREQEGEQPHRRKDWPWKIGKLCPLGEREGGHVGTVRVLDAATASLP